MGIIKLADFVTVVVLPAYSSPCYRDDGLE